MRILVIGASGLIGSHVFRAAQSSGRILTGTYRSFRMPGLLGFDVANSDAARELLEKTQPNSVVYTAGYTWADGCEENPVRAREENSVQPGKMAENCYAQRIHFTYLSSSYVFDGTAGPYGEEARPNPLSVYAQTKWEGEQRVQEACGGAALIVRVICVYGAEAQKKNFAYQVWSAMREGKTLTLPSDQRGNPTYAGDIARWLVTLVERRERGVWHLPGPWPNCTRPEWAEKLVAAFGAAGVARHPNFAIRSVPTAELKQRAPRPLRAGIISTRGGFDFSPTEFNQSILELVRDTPK